FPRVMEEFSGQLSRNIDIEKIISTKLAAISPEQGESFFTRHLDKSFKKASALAIVLGLLIGVIQILIIL
ncbi:MAG TPA: hypothetical protein PLV32_08080, partial [Chitinophagaceae bacterium]|nr:hypothetical protein [Chitinophagaceae bacterium]